MSHRPGHLGPSTVPPPAPLRVPAPVPTRASASAPRPTGCSASRRDRGGFTVVELLVVVAVIGILLGLVLPSLSGALGRGKALREQSNLRQVGAAWLAYSTEHRERALPGYVHRTVQVAWRTRYRYPNRRLIDPSDEQVEQGTELAEPWPLRLAPYLDDVHRLLLEYLPLDLPDDLAIGRDDVIDAGFDDGSGIFAGDRTRAETFAFHPAFGYNAYYVGGWYDAVLPGLRPEPRFSGVLGVDQGGSPVAGSLGPWVIEAVPTVRNASRLVVFCPSSGFPAGQQVAQASTNPQRPGVHYAVPPYVGTRHVWSRSSSSRSLEIAETRGSTPDDGFSVVPLARYAEQVSCLHADGSVRPWLPGELDDQRYWIDRAEAPRDPTHDDD